MKISGLFGALILAIGVASCGGGGDTITPPPPPPPPPNCPAGTFCMTSTTFTPTTRTATVGSTVTWTNDSGVTHDVVWDDATAKAAAGAGDGSGDMGQFASGSHTRVFATAGTYKFHCTIHFGMSGTLTVQ
jgi:Copper binding proteins, plastocyanin/azurin family